MLVLVISDAHANLEALNAVLGDAGEFDVIWSLGDIVGYGPDPNECIARLSEYPHMAVPGNHDWAAMDRLDLDDFNPDARDANLWTRAHMEPTSREYLEALPERHVEGEFTLVHGSPHHPIWEYLLSVDAAERNFCQYETRVCLVGHSHIPLIFRDAPGSRRCELLPPTEGQWVPLDCARYIINPGGVGQPRDRDPRAAYMLLDTAQTAIQHRRVPYDVERTQAKMRAASLPPRLARRLQYGL